MAKKTENRKTRIKHNAAGIERERLLNEVQAERDRLSALLASMSDEVWFADTQKRFTLANPAAMKEFALETDKLMTIEKLATILEVLRPDGSPRPIEEAPPLRALNGEVVINQEEIIRTPAGGELRYRQVSAAPVRDKAGRIIGSVSVVRDITERKQAERMLHENEKRLRIVADFTYDWEYWRSADNRFLYVSPSCEQITGYSREEFIEDPDLYLRIVHPDDRQRVAAHMREDQTNRETYELEFRIARRDGRVRWIAHACRPVFDRNGKLMGRRASNRDFTEKRTAQEQIDDLARFPAENPFPVLRVAKDGAILYNNDPGLAVLKSWHAQESRTVPDDWRRTVEAVIGSAKDQIKEFDLDDGRTISFAVPHVPGKDYANLYGRDITDRKLAAEALQLSERRYRSFVELTSQFAWVTDANGLVAEDVPALRSFTGQTYE